MPEGRSITDTFVIPDRCLQVIDLKKNSANDFMPWQNLITPLKTPETHYCNRIAFVDHSLSAIFVSHFQYVDSETILKPCYVFGNKKKQWIKVFIVDWEEVVHLRGNITGYFYCRTLYTCDSWMRLSRKRQWCTLVEEWTKNEIVFWSQSCPIKQACLFWFLVVYKAMKMSLPIHCWKI